MSSLTTNYNQLYTGKILTYRDIGIVTSRFDYLTGAETNPLYTDSNSTDAFASASWQLNADDFLSFSAGEQYIGVTAYGLKPLTNHSVYVKDKDITAYCKQSGKLLGEGIQTDSNGYLSFILYLSVDLDPSSSIEKMWSLLELNDISTSAVLNIASSDRQSQAKIVITSPKYTGTAENSTNTPYYDEVTDFNFIQTFYADPEVVNNSGEINLTSVVLNFKSKPDSQKNVSGMHNPSVTVSICDVENNQPVLTKVYKNSIARKTANEIIASTEPDTDIVFQLAAPVKLATGRFYGIVITMDDPGFEMWTNRQGDKLYGTNVASSGSTIKRDGNFYRKNTSSVFSAIADTDLKYAIKIAKYSSNTSTEAYVNKDYEFLTLASRSGKFLGGEWVYKEVANAAGTVETTKGSYTIIGNNTTFTSYSPGDYILIHHEGNTVQPYVVQTIVDDTAMTVATRVAFSNVAANYKQSVTGRVYYKDELNNRMFLTDSTANSIIKFVANDVIVGTDSNATAVIESVDVYSVDRLSLKGDVIIPAAGKIDTFLTATKYDGSNFTYDALVAENVDINTPDVKDVTQYDGYVLSRSLEVDNATLFSNTGLGITRKSLTVNAALSVTASNNGLYYSPAIEGRSLDLYTLRNIVSNTYTTTNGNNVTIDSEVGGNGVAASKHISTKVTFANNKFAEDIRLFMTASRPANTELKVYARVHNSADPETFDDKAWTPLEYVSGKDVFAANDSEFVEYELGLGQYPESAKTLVGVFATSSNSTTLVASQPISVGFNANTGVSNTNDFISITNNQFATGEQVFYRVDTGNTAIGGLTPSTPYYVIAANSSGIKLANTAGGTAIDITAGITESGHYISYVLPNDLIKLYNPLIPEDYIIDVINSVSNTTITLNNPVSNNNLVGTGFKVDTLKYNNAAFNNITNDNVARYYNSSLVQFDKFDSMQIKIVFLSDDTFIVPKVDQIQVIGVSA